MLIRVGENRKRRKRKKENAHVSRFVFMQMQIINA